MPRYFVSVPVFAASFVVGCIALGCSGTAVLDAPDPKACASGHGCPMAMCACADGSILIDTTCELGECRPEADVCAERCEPFEGVGSVYASADDRPAVPHCSDLCTRARIHGCELGCDTFFSACETPVSCDPETAGLWECITQRGVFECNDNTLRVTGCEPTALGVCEP